MWNTNEDRNSIDLSTGQKILEKNFLHINHVKNFNFFPMGMNFFSTMYSNFFVFFFFFFFFFFALAGKMHRFSKCLSVLYKKITWFIWRKKKISSLYRDKTTIFYMVYMEENVFPRFFALY